MPDHEDNETADEPDRATIELPDVADDEVRSPAELLNRLVKPRRVVIVHGEFDDNSSAGLHGIRSFTGVLILISGS